MEGKGSRVRDGRARSQRSVCAPARSEGCMYGSWLPRSFVGCGYCHRGRESRERKLHATRKLCYISLSEPVSQDGSEKDLELQEFVIVTCLS